MQQKIGTNNMTPEKRRKRKSKELGSMIKAEGENLKTVLQQLQMENDNFQNYAHIHTTISRTTSTLEDTVENILDYTSQLEKRIKELESGNEIF
jgi:predicted nuclease with TOPRIM domain